MARVIEQLTAAIESKKAFLAPLIKEVRPLRLRRQEVQAQHMEKKVAYNGGSWANIIVVRPSFECI